MLDNEIGLNFIIEIQVYAICVEDPPFLLVTEFLPHGDMKNYLKKAEAKENLPFDKLIRISENVSSNVFSFELSILNK